MTTQTKPQLACVGESYLGKRCMNTAKLWVVSFGADQPMCGVHGRNHRYQWPILSTDSQQDRVTATGWAK